MNLPKSYRGVCKLSSRYWGNYGGWKALLSSPYLHAAILIGLIIFPYKFEVGNLWWDLPLNILPGLVGFSLGGYAIFLAFGDEKFKKLIAWKKDQDADNDLAPSPYLSFSVAFLHFILVQLIAVVLAIIGKSLVLLPVSGLYINISVYLFSIFSFITFIYALLLALAATFAIYRLVWLYDKHLYNENRLDE